MALVPSGPSLSPLEHIASMVAAVASHAGLPTPTPLPPGYHLAPGMMPGGILPGPPSPFTPAFDLAHPNHESASSYAAHTLANQVAAAHAAAAAAGGTQGAGQIPTPPHSTFLQLLTGGTTPTPNPNNDQMHTENVITHLMSALGLAKDPELKTSLSQALAALQKHVASRAKEHQQMLQGKMSPRLMHEAYSNGPAHSGGSVL